jgi:hypothetical protein
MSGKNTVGYNADTASAERSAKQIVIGGRSFSVRKRTVKVMEELKDAAPEAFGLVEISKEDPLGEIRVINKQINVMLRDADGEEPGMEFLDEELDIEDAYRLMETLSPSVAEEGERLGD